MSSVSLCLYRCLHCCVKCPPLISEGIYLHVHRLPKLCRHLHSHAHYFFLPSTGSTFPMPAALFCSPCRHLHSHAHCPSLVSGETCTHMHTASLIYSPAPSLTCTVQSGFCRHLHSHAHCYAPLCRNLDVCSLPSPVTA